MRSLFFLLASIVMSLSATAQSVGDAFYIYRNDGGFNAFFRDEVDSISYSHYDADSLLYDEIVSQVVYTKDSIYYIPLEAIDSLSFVRPETVFKQDVVQMKEKGLIDYLKAVDGMSLIFEKSMPQKIYPNKGDILLFTDFDHPILSNGFIGKVQNIDIKSDILRVDCDSIYDIFEIFEQLISIERINVKDDEATHAKSRRISDEWISSRNTLNFNLGFSHPISDGEVSLSGSVDGTYIATVIFNITHQEQYISLKINHDWQYGAHLKFKKELGSFGTLFGPVASLPAIRFPAVAPVFKFQISGSPFVKGEGNMELDFSLNSPVHSYIAQAVYHNGRFSGWNHKVPTQGGSLPSFDAVFSLNGSLQIGYMIDFWLGLDVSIKGIAKDLLKVGTGLDFYVGPKITGDFTMKMGTDTPINYYSIYKDSKLGLSLLTVDYEFFGEASLAGHKFPRAMFCNGSIQTPLYHEWYIMPEFSDLNIYKDYENSQAIINTVPTRDILFPLGVGIGLSDSDGNLLSTKYENRDYKRENEGFEIQQTFETLEKGRKYVVKPYIKILGGEIGALPVDTFKLDDDIPVEIVKVNMEKASYYPNHYTYNNKQYSFKYNCTTYVTLKDNTNVADWGYIYIDPDGQESEPISLKQYSGTVGDPRYAYCRNEPSGTVKLKGFVRYKDDEEIHYGEIQEFPIEYPTESSVTMTNCTFQGTENNASYQGKTYKYKSTYRYLFNASGAYWLKVGTEETGSGWSNWNNLPDYATSPVDGANALTVNYYYDDKTFSGDYDVYLKGTDATHSVSHTTSEYVTYTHSASQFTGCSYHAGTASSRAQGIMENDEEYNIVINKPIY